MRPRARAAARFRSLTTASTLGHRPAGDGVEDPHDRIPFVRLDGVQDDAVILDHSNNPSLQHARLQGVMAQEIERNCRIQVGSSSMTWNPAADFFP